jgi:hypothetical protein
MDYQSVYPISQLIEKSKRHITLSDHLGNEELKITAYGPHSGSS